jgi:hypothetical protein
VKRLGCNPGRRLLGLMLLVLCTGHAAATPLFDDDAVVDVTLTGPFGALFASVGGPERVELPFSLESGGSTQAVEVRLRGHSRLRVCAFPPLRLEFHGDIEPGSPFAGQDKLKLVTHCRNYDRGEQDLLEEYAAYRVLNVVTDLSYRVRLLRMHYRDTDGALPREAESRFGFVLEPREAFAARTGMAAVDLDGFPRYRHDPRQAAVIYVAQYLLANTDWQLLRADYEDECCHNLDLFERDAQVVFVPYDFDLTGLVNARYAYPDPRLRIRQVRQRLYRGLCTEREYLQAALELIESRKEQILDVVRNVPGLEPRNVERAVDFLGDFFEDAEDGDRLLRSFEKRCLDGY